MIDRTRLMVLVGLVLVLCCPIVASAGEKVKGGFENVTFKQKVRNCTIDAEYPRFHAGKIPKEAIARVNNEVERYVKQYIAAFLKDGLYGSTFVAEKDRSNEKVSEGISFKVIRADSRYVSVKFDRYHYEEGGAHGLAVITTFNYDVTRKRMVQIEDLFEPKTPYLVEISKICIRELIKQLETNDVQWVKDGVSPDKKSFQAFAFNDKALIIYTQPYQVACYALGYPEVKIPYKSLQGVSKEFNIK